MYHLIVPTRAGTRHRSNGSLHRVPLRAGQAIASQPFPMPIRQYVVLGEIPSEIECQVRPALR